MKKDYMFTSESVTEGHPDKLCDQISDAIVDHFLMQDPYASLRIESAVSSAIVFIAGHFATKGKVDLPLTNISSLTSISSPTRKSKKSRCTLRPLSSASHANRLPT